MCGLLLVLLGAWGALAPFIGPDLHFGYSPDSAFAYTEGRLVLSAVPGVVALLAGLIVLVTRSRGLGAVAGFLAALAGVWFIVGAVVVAIMPSVFKSGTVITGLPLSTGATTIALTELSFFAGTGALIVFFGALAMGRFSLLAAKDPGAAGTAAGVGAAYGGYQGGGQSPSVQLQYPAGPAFAADPYAPADQDQHQPEPNQATATQDLGRAADYPGGANYPSDPQQYAAQQGYQATQYAGQQQQYPAQQQLPAQPDQAAQQDYQAQQYGSQQQYGGQQYGAQQQHGGDQYPAQQDYAGASDNPISHERYPATPGSQPPFPPAPKPVGSADPTRTMDQPDTAATQEPGSQW